MFFFNVLNCVPGPRPRRPPLRRRRRGSRIPEFGESVLSRNGEREVLERLRRLGDSVAGEALHRRDQLAVEYVRNDRSVSLGSPFSDD